MIINAVINTMIHIIHNTINTDHMTPVGMSVYQIICGHDTNHMHMFLHVSNRCVCTVCVYNMSVTHVRII